MRISGMINFTRAFDSAWERMLVILFRPFNLGKWFAIGFSAFLAGLLEGGNGFNGSYSGSSSSTGTANESWTTYVNPLQSFNAGKVSSAFSGIQAGEMFFVGGLIVISILAVVLLMAWLGARGEFMLLDNIVRNRGAIAWPWRNYSRQGNSFFFFYLLYFVFTLVVLIPVTIVEVMIAMPLLRTHRWPEGGEILVFVALGLVYLAVLFALSTALFLFRELGIPLMFRHGMMARAAVAATCRLVARRPWAVCLFVLLRIALFIALLILAVIVCCVLCCTSFVPYPASLALLPAVPFVLYLQSVLLLPGILYIKCFTLDFLAQFGPEYDVWTVDVPPAIPPPQL